MSATATPGPNGTAPPEPAAPASEPHLGGVRDLLLFILAALALFLLVQSVAMSLVFYQVQQQNPNLPWPELTQKVVERIQYNAFFFVPVQIAYNALLVGLLYWMVRRRDLPFWKGLAWRPLASARVLPILLGGAALALVVQFANVVVPPPEKLPFDRLFSSQTAAWLIIATSLLVAPLVEELVFRGYIYTLLERLWGVLPAVLLSGILFGSIHFSQLSPGYFQVFLLCVVGLTFSWIRARTGTVLASVLAHLGYNATISLLFLSSQQFRALPAVF